MVNIKFIHDIDCPYCGCRSLKLLPVDNTFINYIEDSCFCSECGRHAINIIKPERKVA